MRSSIDVAAPIMYNHVKCKTKKDKINEGKWKAFYFTRIINLP